jgi:hypothetical protein
MNPDVIREFGKAWQAVHYGKADTERAILLFRKADGSLSAESLGYTNEFNSFTFKWNPAAIAIVHTHRNKEGAEPAPADKEVANRLGVPIFTITSRGMYVYDPENREVIKVQDGLDWLDASKWSKRTVSKTVLDRIGEHGPERSSPECVYHDTPIGDQLPAEKHTCDSTTSPFLKMSNWTWSPRENEKVADRAFSAQESVP